MPKVRSWLLATAMAMPMAMLVSPAPGAEAQSATINIPAGTLSESLKKLAVGTGTNILFASETVAGKHGHEVAGAKTTAEALAQLLAGTGLGFTADSDGSITITAKMPDSEGRAQKPAASAEHAADGDQPNEIVVTGSYAQSLREATNVKRQAESIMDVISADDVGKFPSRNIGEALQRVTGVTLDRTGNGATIARGEGVHINIRGLPGIFQNVQLNGRNIAVNEAVENGGKDGRQFRFDVLPSDIISRVDVLKSPTADMGENGIAANVDLRTYRPLDIGTTMAASAKGTYGELADALDPSASGLASWANDEKTLGLLVSGGYTARTARQDRAFMNIGWFTGRDATLFPTNDIYTPSRQRPTIETENRERSTINTTLQFKPNQEFESNFDVLFTHLDNFYKEYGVDYFLETGKIRPGSVTLAGKTAIAGTIDNATVQLSDETSDQRHNLYSIGFNQAWTPGPWKFGADVNYSRADSDTIDPIRRARFIQKGTINYDFSSGYKSLPTLTSNIDLNNPSGWTSSLGSLQARVEQATDTDLATRFDATREFTGIISRVKVGFSHEEREHDYFRVDRNATAFVNVTPASAGPGSVLPLPISDYFAGFGGGYPRRWLDPNNKFLFSNFFDDNSLRTPLTALDQANTSEITETVVGGYALASFETTLGGIPFSGNFGSRIASTEQISSGAAVTGRTATPVHFEKDYTDFLPAVNLRLDPRDDLVLRFAAARAISRPNLGDVAPGLTLATDVATATGGNPNLDPYRSTNIDGSIEWYFNSFGKLTAAGFLKDFDSFETASVTQITVPGSKFGTYNLTSLVNGGSARLTGFELGYQQVFNFLPAPFDGLGLEAGYTQVYQDSLFTTGTRVVRNQLTGVSPSSYSLVAFYEKGPVEARLGYSWRDAYLAVNGAVNGTDEIFDAFGSLDGSLSYHLTQNVTLVAEAVNLTDASIFTYASVKSRPQEIFHYGRSFSFGTRFKF